MCFLFWFPRGLFLKTHTHLSSRFFNVKVQYSLNRQPSCPNLSFLFKKGYLWFQANRQHFKAAEFLFVHSLQCLLKRCCAYFSQSPVILNHETLVNICSLHFKKCSWLVNLIAASFKDSAFLEHMRTSFKDAAFLRTVYFLFRTLFILKMHYCWNKRVSSVNEQFPPPACSTLQYQLSIKPSIWASALNSSAFFSKYAAPAYNARFLSNRCTIPQTKCVSVKSEAVLLQRNGHSLQEASLSLNIQFEYTVFWCILLTNVWFLFSSSFKRCNQRRQQTYAWSL